MSNIEFVGPSDMEPWMRPDTAPDCVVERFKCETCGMGGGPLGAGSYPGATFKMRCHCGIVYEIVGSAPRGDVA